MRIGAISFQPYVYNVNAISPVSMNRLSRISDNVLDKKTDFEGLVENENPLKKGQTLNFEDMLKMQMQRGRSNAARLMRPAEEEANDAEQTQNAAVTSEQENVAGTAQPEKESALQSVQADAQTAASGGDNTDSSVSNFRMQQAISAYEMFMTA
ncbi:MAG: hypothetical protein NC302_04635 [Bacteroidales bacterium]|nr:hypothetical protein [Bacteroidales bacterium]MCM1415650.1 hypothetical protein [bacterium]MCM1422970.1 hypothetical protein [bacterium]